MITERKRILVVDDERDLAASLGDTLDLGGYDVRIAFTAAEALKEAADFTPHGVLMDIRLPGVNGIDAFRAIRKVCPGAFVIFMTGFSSSQLVADARREGAVQIFAKPFDVTEVVATIERTARQTSVLLVDDDPGFRESLGDALRAQHVDVKTATTAEEALVLFEREPRRAVILDMKLGDMIGADAALLFRDINSHALIILVTGYPEFKARMVQGAEQLCCTYFEKPFDIGDLISAIQLGTREG